ncbi:MAG TPA: DUF1858 domain-containing protein [Bacteroidetes bacterium]|nr:DUF1858 domain-containing protein [Bacteroidota bacterium]
MARNKTATGVEITPDTRLGLLLKAYPELEEVLMGLSPEFARLRNPVLRRTVAKVATLRQVAQLGGLPLGELINTLRKAAGKEEIETLEEWQAEAGEPPDWLRQGKLVRRLDARPILEEGGHPVEQVSQEVERLKPGEIFELLVPFEPAPLIELIQKKGFRVWVTRRKDGLFATYFSPEPR